MNKGERRMKKESRECIYDKWRLQSVCMEAEQSRVKDEKRRVQDELLINGGYIEDAQRLNRVEWSQAMVERSVKTSSKVQTEKCIFAKRMHHACKLSQYVRFAKTGLNTTNSISPAFFKFLFLKISLPSTLSPDPPLPHYPLIPPPFHIIS